MSEQQAFTKTGAHRARASRRMRALAAFGPPLLVAGLAFLATYLIRHLGS